MPRRYNQSSKGRRVPNPGAEKYDQYDSSGETEKLMQLMFPFLSECQLEFILEQLEAMREDRDI